MNSPSKPIPGYEGLYSITKDGYIISTPRPGSSRGYIKSFKNNRGYLKCYLYKEKRKKEFSLHQLVAKTYLENKNNFKEVNHKNGNKEDNNVENLEWCSRKENMKHAYLNGLVKLKHGDEHHNAKLNYQIVDEIRTKINKKDKNLTQLAKEYNVHKSTLSLIKNNKLWK